LDKSGTLIGGSDKGGMVLLNSMINDIIDWLSLGYSVVLQQWLDHNGFVGYNANAQLPHVEIDATELNIEKCRAGYETQALALSERRKLLGHEETDDATATAIQEEYSAVTPPPTGIFQNATPITQDKTLNADMASGGVTETELSQNATRYESDIKRILGIKK
jgi:hypothetical protein